MKAAIAEWRACHQLSGECVRWIGRSPRIVLRGLAFKSSIPRIDRRASRTLQMLWRSVREHWATVRDVEPELG